MPSATPAVDNGPPMTQTEFEALFEEVSRWDGRPPRPDCLGAVALVRLGVVVALGLPWDTAPGPDNTTPALHYFTQLGDADSAEPAVFTDFVGTDYHGKSQTHIDALCHLAYRERFFGGVPAHAAVTSRGATYGAVTDLLPGIIGRGVLLDVARGRAQNWLEPGQAIPGDELLSCAQRQNIVLRSGDVVLTRTGSRARRQVHGAWDPDLRSAGLHPTAMRVVAGSACALGSDGDTDVRPSPVEGVVSPVHVLAINALGIPLLDNLDLETLGALCERHGRWEFLFVAAPLNIPGGTGSPVNPVAIL